MKQILTALILVSALAAAGCSSDDTSSSSVPTTPSSPLVTENFSGTVQVGGSDAHPFSVISSGFQITLDLTSVGPPSTISMGFGIGSWDGTTCTLLTGGFGTVQASSTPQLGGNINAGTYCAVVFDVGNQSAPVTYTAVILHY